MPNKFYLEPLGYSGEDFLRVRFTTNSGAVTRYTVQYETVIAGVRKIVVRYDNAHDVPHRDLFDISGNEVNKDWYPGLSNEEALTTASKDLKDNWSSYRERFDQE